MRTVLPAMLLLAACAGGDDGSPATDTAEPGAGPVAAAVTAPDDLLWFTGEPLALETDATGTAVRWDFGDGTEASGWSVEHTWDAPGRYRMVLQVDGAPPAQDDWKGKLVECMDADKIPVRLGGTNTEL